MPTKPPDPGCGEAAPLAKETRPLETSHQNAGSLPEAAAADKIVARAIDEPAEEFTPFTPTPEWLEANGVKLPTPDWQDRIAQRREATERLMPQIMERVARSVAEPRPLAELKFFRTAEHPKSPGSLIIELPPYFAEGGATCVRHAVLRDDGCQDMAPVYAVLKRLWRRRLLPPQCYLVAAFARGMTIAMDASDENVAAYREAVERLQWSFPFLVTVTRMHPREERLVESLGLGPQYPASDSGSAP